MKKIIFASSIILLVAAGCSSSQQAAVQTTPVAQTDQSPTPSPTATAMTTPTPSSVMSPTPSPTASPKPTPSQTQVQGTVVLKLGSSILGQELTANNGMTLYYSAADSSNVSNCTGSCASSWPPYTVAAGTRVAAATGLTGKVGTINRADGTSQVTYNNKPLYFWTGDAKAGDTTGNMVNGFYVVKP